MKPTDETLAQARMRLAREARGMGDRVDVASMAYEADLVVHGGQLYEVYAPPEKLMELCLPGFLRPFLVPPCEICETHPGVTGNDGVRLCEDCRAPRRKPPAYRRPLWLRFLRWLARL